MSKVLANAAKVAKDEKVNTLKRKCEINANESCSLPAATKKIAKINTTNSATENHKIENENDKTDSLKSISTNERHQWWTRHANTRIIHEPDGHVSILIHVPRYMYANNKSAAIAVHEMLKNQEWPQQRVKVMMGHVMPRDVVWYQKEQVPYVFSRKRFEAQPKWPQPLVDLCDYLNQDLNELTKPLQSLYSSSFQPICLNSVLLNRYVTQNDSISPHADNEPLFGKYPTIVSLSCGATRTFKVSRKSPKIFDKELKFAKHLLPAAVTMSANPSKTKTTTYSYTLRDGDLFIMAGATQDYWHHRIDKELTFRGNANTLRYNMTWRNVV